MSITSPNSMNGASNPFASTWTPPLPPIVQLINGVQSPTNTAGLDSFTNSQSFMQSLLSPPAPIPPTSVSDTSSFGQNSFVQQLQPLLNFAAKPTVTPVLNQLLFQPITNTAPGLSASQQAQQSITGTTWQGSFPALQDIFQLFGIRTLTSPANTSGSTPVSTPDTTNNSFMSSLQPTFQPTTQPAIQEDHPVINWN